jgi:hypothetical protein
MELYLHLQLRDGMFRYAGFTFMKLLLCGEFQFVLFCNMSDTRSVSFIRQGFRPVGFRMKGPRHAPLLDPLPTDKPKDEIGVESLC